MNRMEFKPFAPETFTGNPFTMLSRDWMLVTAGQPGDFNTMTASWGFWGHVWTQNVLTAVVRHQRHTFGFMERYDHFTCSFYPPECRAALDLCGSKSGRDMDKPKAAGLTPVAVPGLAAVTFAEARLTFVCRKLYSQDMTEAAFADKDLLDRMYPGRDLHRMYVGAIELVSGDLDR
jgi:flavin reductase (DIM6/NTAB) family NADH-FMN oxidoreductase RutF